MGKVLGGDFPEGSKVSTGWGSISITTPMLSNEKNENIKGKIQYVEIITEENKKKFLGAAGWGLAGAIGAGFLTGGIGLLIGGLAGVLKGGRSKEICFACQLKDGRKFIAITEPKVFQKILGDSISK